MYDNSIKLIEMPEHNAISVCVYIENDEILALGERINAEFDEAYMNGYGWDAVIRFYVEQVDPELMNVVKTDPEAGMFSAYTIYSPENLDAMKRFESHVSAMLADEQTLRKFIGENRDDIEWD